MEIGAVWKRVINLSDPFIALSFSTDRAKATFTGTGNNPYLTRMIGTCKGSKTEAIRFSAIHDFPDIVSHVPGNECFMLSNKALSVFLKDLF